MKSEIGNEFIILTDHIRNDTSLDTSLAPSGTPPLRSLSTRGGWCLRPNGKRYASCTRPSTRPTACVLCTSQQARTSPVRVPYASRVYASRGPCTRPVHVPYASRVRQYASGVRFDQRGTRNRRDGPIQSELIHIPLLHGTSTTRPCPWPPPNPPLYYCPWRGATLD